MMRQLASPMNSKNSAPSRMVKVLLAHRPGDRPPEHRRKVIGHAAARREVVERLKTPACQLTRIARCRHGEWRGARIAVDCAGAAWDDALRKARDAVDGAPDTLAAVELVTGDRRRIGEEQEGARRQRNVEDVHPHAAEHLFTDHDAEARAHRDSPQRDVGEISGINILVTKKPSETFFADGCEQHLPEAAGRGHSEDRQSGTRRARSPSKRLY